MAIKLIGACLLTLALLGCLANAQYFANLQENQKPKPPKFQPRPELQDRQRPDYNRGPETETSPVHSKKGTSQPTDSCEVPGDHKIQCGAADISSSECEAINCCFDGRMCYYGKFVTLQCTKDAQFIVVVARSATLPNLDLETISFRGQDRSCGPVGTTSAFAIYQFSATDCGTVMTEEPGVITYENSMVSSFEVAVGTAGSITRDSQYQLLMQCRYVGTSVEALVIEVGLVPPPHPVAAAGPLNVELRLGNGVCASKGCAEEQVAYTSYYVESDYPVTKVLRDPVYVEVRILERTDPNIVLTLGRCWATSNPFPQSFPQWDLLIDGCPNADDNYLTTLAQVEASQEVPFPTHYRRFIWKMFTFMGRRGGSGGKQQREQQLTQSQPEEVSEPIFPLKEKVYIHCNAAVCQPSLGDNCEPRCFRKRRDIAASVQRSSRPQAVVVSSQQIVIVDSQ